MHGYLLSSANPDFEELMVGKTRVIALNKADLADPSATEAWIKWFQSNENKCNAYQFFRF